MSAERPERGELWDLLPSFGGPSRVQIKSVTATNTYTFVRFRVLTSPNQDFVGQDQVSHLAGFMGQYTMVDLDAELTPKVRRGEKWRSKTPPKCEVTVVFFHDDVVTFRRTGREDTPGGGYDASNVEWFLANHTRKPAVTAIPPTDDVQDHLFVVADSDDVTGDVHWSVPTPRDGFGVLRVPLDWSKATWEVQP